MKVFSIYNSRKALHLELHLENFLKMICVCTKVTYVRVHVTPAFSWGVKNNFGIEVYQAGADAYTESDKALLLKKSGPQDYVMYW